MRNLLVLLSLLGLVVGCTQSTATPSPEATAVTTVNQHCPIMGGGVTPEGGTTQWNGQTIGFCCDGCDSKWEALSDKEKGEKLASADHAENASHDHGNHDHS